MAREALLDEARFDRSVREAARSGLFDAVELREDLRAAGDGDPPTPERIVRASIGTDFALTLARTLYCSRLPVPETVLAEIVAELNALNDRYDGTGERYRWDPIEDNCSHAIHNAIAASGVWDPKRTRLGGVGHLRQFTQDGGWHLSFPFNSMVRLAEAGNARPIDDVFEAFRDTDLRRTFDRHGWVSTRHGALVDVKPIHEEGRNLLFREGKMPFAGSLPFDLPEPVRRTLSRREIATLNPEGRFRELFSGAEYRSIRENLERYRRRYRAILADAQSPPDSRRAYRRMSEHEKREFLDFRTRFHAYVREQLRDVEGKLVRYGELERASAMAPRGASRRPRSPRPGPPTARAPSRRGYQPPGTAQRLRGRKAGSESPPSQNRVAHPGAPA